MCNVIPLSNFKSLFLKTFLLRDLLARERSQDALVSENGELKTNFKYDLPKKYNDNNTLT